MGDQPCSDLLLQSLLNTIQYSQTRLNISSNSPILEKLLKLSKIKKFPTRVWTWVNNDVPIQPSFPQLTIAERTDRRMSLAAALQESDTIVSFEKDAEWLNTLKKTKKVLLIE